MTARTFTILWWLWLWTVVLGACQTGDSSRPPAASGRACVFPSKARRGLIVAGSGSNLALVRAIAHRYEEVYPGSLVQVPEAIGTGNAVRALANDDIDVGLASRPLRPAEPTKGLEEVPLARVVMAFVVDDRLPIQELDERELLALYRGDMTSWPDGTPALPLLRQHGDQGNVLITTAVPAMGPVLEQALAARRFPVLFSDQEVRDVMLETRGALGLIDLGTLRLERLPFRPLPLGGIAPTVANAAAGRYLMVKTLFFLVKQRTPEITRWLEFARSPRVADILASGDFLPPEDAGAP